MVEQQQRQQCQHVSKRRKVVSFQSCPPEIQTIPVLSDEEISARWYNKEEFREIKTSMVQVLRLMISNKAGDEQETYTTRGLEMLTPKGLQYTKQTRLKVLAAIWNAQVKQWDEQNALYDPEAIADAVRKETVQASQLARNFGLIDQRFAIEGFTTKMSKQQQEQLSSRQQQPTVNRPHKTSFTPAAA